jgi:hypothetical protein
MKMAQQNHSADEPQMFTCAEHGMKLERCKSSICALGMFYKSGVYAMKVSCLTSGDLLNCPGKLRAAEIGWELSNQF